MAVLIPLRISGVSKQGHFSAQVTDAAYLWRLLSWALGSPLQFKLQDFPVLNKKMLLQLFSLRWLSHEQAASAPLCLTCCCLSLRVPAGSPPEVTPTALLLLRCPWAILCEARWRRSRGLGSDCGLRPGETAHQLLLLLLLSLSVLTQALWIWRP